MGRTRIADERLRLCERQAARWNGAAAEAVDAETLKRRKRELLVEIERAGMPVAPAVERRSGVLVSR